MFIIYAEILVYHPLAVIPTAGLSMIPRKLFLSSNDFAARNAWNAIIFPLLTSVLERWALACARYRKSPVLLQKYMLRWPGPTAACVQIPWRKYFDPEGSSVSLSTSSQSLQNGVLFWRKKCGFKTRLNFLCALSKFSYRFSCPRFRPHAASLLVAVLIFPLILKAYMQFVWKCLYFTCSGFHPGLVEQD